MNNWAEVYNLRNDVGTIIKIVNASNDSGEFGYIQENGEFGSKKWWDAIENGLIEKKVCEGIITKKYLTGHGDWPEFEVSAKDGKSSWTLEGEDNYYSVGK
jgi:hypothetical protein